MWLTPLVKIPRWVPVEGYLPCKTTITLIRMSIMYYFELLLKYQ